MENRKKHARIVPFGLVDTGNLRLGIDSHTAEQLNSSEQYAGVVDGESCEVSEFPIPHLLVDLNFED